MTVTRPRFAAAGFAVVLAAAAGPATRPTYGPAVTAVAGPTTTFTGDSGFTLKYPADWIAPPHPDEGQAFTVWMPLSPAAAATRPAGAVNVGKVDQLKGLKVGGLGLRVEQVDGASDQQVVHDLSGSMAANLFADLDLAATHVAIKPAVVGDLPARAVRFVIHPGGGPAVTVAYVVACHKGTEYVFNVAAPTAAFDRLWPQVEAVLKSFEVKE